MNNQDNKTCIECKKKPKTRYFHNGWWYCDKCYEEVSGEELE